MRLYQNKNTSVLIEELKQGRKLELKENKRDK